MLGPRAVPSNDTRFTHRATSGPVRVRDQAGGGMEGRVSLSLPGIFAVNPPALAELPGRKSRRRSREEPPPLLAAELRQTLNPASSTGALSWRGRVFPGLTGVL